MDKESDILVVDGLFNERGKSVYELSFTHLRTYGTRSVTHCILSFETGVGDIQRQLNHIANCCNGFILTTTEEARQGLHYNLPKAVRIATIESVLPLIKHGRSTYDHICREHSKQKDEFFASGLECTKNRLHRYISYFKEYIFSVHVISNLFRLKFEYPSENFWESGGIEKTKITDFDLNFDFSFLDEDKKQRTLFEEISDCE